MKGIDGHRFGDKKTLAEFYRQSFRDDVIAYWEVRTIDDTKINRCYFSLEI